MSQIHLHSSLTVHREFCSHCSLIYFPLFAEFPLIYLLYANGFSSIETSLNVHKKRVKMRALLKKVCKSHKLRKTENIYTKMLN